MASEMAAVSTLKSDVKCKWGIPNKRQKLTEDRMKTWDQAKRLEEEDTKKLKLKGKKFIKHTHSNLKTWNGYINIRENSLR